MTLIDWKSKVKAKAGGIKSYESKTGGGPPCIEQLSSVENKLLCLMGKSSYEGNSQNNEVGLKKRRLSDNQHGQDIMPPVHRNKREGNDKIAIINNQILKQAIKPTSTVLSGISPVSSSRDFCQTIGTPKLILVNPNKAQPYQQTPATFTKYDQAVHTSSIPLFLNENTQKKNDILKNMKMTVTKIPISSATPECSLQDQGETAESTVEQRHSQKKLRKSGSTDTMLSMHNDLVNILEKINVNLGSLASSGKEVVDILKN
ncbi:hypothetical protein JTB14_028259 [Gonioctena quinquepunctata]|nr:hypothetical protein JTB14_028259 [Gonioctena quinquepunctata]